ncbi:MAG: kelch repeat-containing protein [bacterium]
MKRLIALIAILLLSLLANACGGSGGGEGTPADGPLTLKFLSAQPSSGASPLSVIFTTNVSGGVAPFYYSFDFNNDAAPDRYINNSFDRTVSVSNQYFLNQADAGGATSYEAFVKVVDSEGTEVSSSLVNVLVNASGEVVIGGIDILSDFQNVDGSYEFRSGSPVYFRTNAEGGSTLSYEWDFNGDGIVDSTVQNPQNTFFYDGDGVKVFLVGLSVINEKGEEAQSEVLVPVQKANPEIGPDPVPDFDIILTTNPSPSGGRVILEWDPSGAKLPAVGVEPTLDLSVVVDPKKPGVAPFEYYWDYQSDNNFDSSDISPTIPYYDLEKKIFVNPYAHAETEKSYTLKVQVIDGTGRIRSRSVDILSRNVAQINTELNVTGQYGVSSAGGAFSENPPLQYDVVTGRSDSTSVTWDYDVSGSTGEYVYQVDVDNDGNVDFPDLADQPTGFEPVSGGSFSYTATFDGTTWPAVGYYGAVIRVRALQNATVVDEVVLNAPVSLVQRTKLSVGGEYALVPRSHHQMLGTYTAQAGGGNGNFLAERRFRLMGGESNGNPLSTSELFVQPYAQPDQAGTIEIGLESSAAKVQPMVQQATGGFAWISANEEQDNPTLWYLGGENVVDGVLRFAELIAAPAFDGNTGWSIAGNNIGGGPRKEAMGVMVPQTWPRYSSFDGGLPLNFVYLGGFSPGNVNEVNGSLWSHNPARPPLFLPEYANLNADMLTPRYDGAAVYLNGFIYVMGGRGASGQSTATMEILNLSSGLWVEGPPLKEARSGHVAHVIGGKIYVIGGAFYPFDTSQKQMVNTAEVFDPVTGVWSYTAPLPNTGGVDARTENAASAALPAPGSVDLGGALNSVIVYHGGSDLNDNDKSDLYQFQYLYTVDLPAAP